MNKAAFSLDRYVFEKAQIDFTKNTSEEIDISFNPMGKFIKGQENSKFELSFEIIVHNGDKENGFVKVLCLSYFDFEGKITFEEIPTYFYRNSIAIIFPYLRSFISTLTLQANRPPLVLPTLNLSSLEEPLKRNTKEE
ncbi:protein-export chaperone SecB [Flavicella sediminum]|uniref:protein-export chaperone SecB n=1 Tax=Flavicella sediminum TaxID=2585141 RepID=UPI0011239E79|nr:protein-export chaperone SecB [Flavicella sediminum]